MLKAKKRWEQTPFNQEKVELLADGLHVSPIVAQLLVKRGFETIDDAKCFLHTNDQPFYDPFLLDDMEKAVERIQKAIKNNENILVFGDYDADGVSSTTIVVSALQALGANVDFYIPNRFTEGYGPNPEAFKWAKSAGFSVIVTVDTGIAAIQEAKLAVELGLDLIITDHHEVGPILPECFAIIHPKKPDSNYPFKELAGAGVALKLAHALLGECPKSLIEIAAIGTIADLVPLIDENRLIAIKGIEQLKQTERLGLRMLFKLSSVDQTQINEETVGFTIAPRINAIGRLDSAAPAVHLLLSQNSEEAFELATLIDDTNKERQSIVTKLTEEAIREVEEKFPLKENLVLVIAKEGWNAGVIGIVASRLVEKYYRPVIILSIDAEKGLAKGSARSIAGFDLYQNLSHCRDILPHFGGHTMAAGMSLKIEDIETLRSRLNELANQNLTKEDFIPISTVDIMCKLEDITLEVIEQINQLAPFGVHNPKPKVMVKDLSVDSIRKIGSNQSHIKITFEQEGCTLDSVGFGFGYLSDEISPLASVHVLGELSINEWNNFRKPQLYISDLAINEWQLFDYRGTKDIRKILLSIPSDKRTIVVFNDETSSLLKLEEFEEDILHITGNDSMPFDLNSQYVVLLDLPSTHEAIQSLLTIQKPERIYAIFFNQQNHFFSTIPTREHFKWYYAFLAKKGPFDYRKNAKELASFRGWSKDTVDFMSKVFFDLNFVKIENGLIYLLSNTKKRDLTESKTYQMKQMQIEIENMYLYSSYQQLKQCFDNLMKETLIINS